MYYIEKRLKGEESEYEYVGEDIDKAERRYEEVIKDHDDPFNAWVISLFDEGPIPIIQNFMSTSKRGRFE